MIIKLISKSLLAIGIITLGCALYTGFITIVSQTFFHDQANGSLVMKKNQLYGSKLIAQPFSGNDYMWGRQMNLIVGDISGNSKSQQIMYATASQLSPNDLNYQKSVKQKAATIQERKNQNSDQKVPIELLTNSGSGLDPEISPAAARYQVKRIAQARNVSEQEVSKVIEKNTKPRTLGILGESRVNVLAVNLDLDKLTHTNHQ